MRLSEGDVRVTLLDGGRVWLDGGAMFGVVPKALWQKRRPPDDANRICLALNVLLIEDGRTTALVDTGLGSKLDDKTARIHRAESRTAGELLEPAGLKPEQIDLVVSTHLHFDHAGGNTSLAADGSVEAAFPNARYVMQRGEVELARQPNERIRASYPSENFEPLIGSDRVQWVAGDATVTPWIRTRLAPGHTPHMQIVLVDAGAETFAFLADLVPTASHLPYGWIMGYDLDPLKTLETKKRILPEAVREGWRVVFEHDHRLPTAVLEERGSGGIAARPAGVEA